MSDPNYDADYFFNLAADLARVHAAALTSNTRTAVLDVTPACPRCGGRLITGDTNAACAAGCDWRGPVPE